MQKEKCTLGSSGLGLFLLPSSVTLGKSLTPLKLPSFVNYRIWPADLNGLLGELNNPRL